MKNLLFLLKVGGVTIEVLILMAIGSYFILEGFGRNLALDVFLALIGATSVLILVSVIRRAKRGSLRHKDVT